MENVNANNFWFKDAEDESTAEAIKVLNTLTKEQWEAVRVYVESKCNEAIFFETEGE